MHGSWSVPVPVPGAMHGDGRKEESWLPVPVPSAMEEPPGSSTQTPALETRSGWDSQGLAQRSQQLNDLRNWADCTQEDMDVKGKTTPTPRLIDSSNEIWKAVFSEITSIQQNQLSADAKATGPSAEVLDTINKVREEMAVELGNLRTAMSKFIQEDLLSVRASVYRLGERVAHVEGRLSRTEGEALELRGQIELQDAQQQDEQSTMQNVTSEQEALRDKLSAVQKLASLNVTWQSGQDQLGQAIGFLAHDLEEIRESMARGLSPIGFLSHDVEELRESMARIGFLSHDVEELRESMARGLSKLWLEIERLKVQIAAGAQAGPAPSTPMTVGSFDGTAYAHNIIISAPADGGVPPDVASQSHPGSNVRSAAAARGVDRTVGSHGGVGSISGSRHANDTRAVRRVNHDHAHAHTPDSSPRSTDPGSLRLTDGTTTSQDPLANRGMEQDATTNQRNADLRNRWPPSFRVPVKCESKKQDPVRLTPPMPCGKDGTEPSWTGQVEGVAPDKLRREWLSYDPNVEDGQSQGLRGMQSAAYVAVPYTGPNPWRLSRA